MSSRRALALLLVPVLATLVLIACGPMLRGSTSPPPPPSGRGGDCYAPRSSCQAGLTCVQFYQNNISGAGATCEVPCGEGGACPGGMRCGDRGDLFWGAKARNVCLGEPTPTPPAPTPTPTPEATPSDSGDGGIPVDADMSGTWQKVP